MSLKQNPLLEGAPMTRESILISSVRSFCTAFAGMIGILIGLILAILIIAIAKPSLTSNKTVMLIAADAEGNREVLSDSSPVILRINIHGEIGTRDLNAKLVESQLLDSREGPLKKGRVKAILLHINSPGGTVEDANNIYTYLMEYKEKHQIPIYAYVDGLCASGGMYIACSADKIFSSPVGAIGSIGVILGPNFNLSELMKKLGISQLTLTRGKDKDALNPFRPWLPNESDSYQDILSYDYKRFVDLVVKNRPKVDKNQLINVYGAQVFDPIKAQEIGYIDEGNASYKSTLKALVKAANIKGEYQVIELKIPHPILSDLIDGKSPLFSGKIKHEVQLIPEIKGEWINRPLYLYSPILQSTK